MIRPFELIKLPVPPRPAGPTDTRASERQAASLFDVPSMSLAGTRKPIAFKAGSSAVASVIGHERKREGCNADGGAVVIAALMRAVRKTKVDAVNDLRRPVSMQGRGREEKAHCPEPANWAVKPRVNGKGISPTHLARLCTLSSTSSPDLRSPQSPRTTVHHPDRSCWSSTS